MIPMMLNYTKNNQSNNSLNSSNSLKPQAISTTITAEEMKRRRSSSGMQSFSSNTQKILPSQNLPPYLPTKIVNNPQNILSSSIGFNRTNTNALVQINSTITTSPQRMRTSSIDSIFLTTNRPATIQQFFQPRNPMELLQSPNLVVSNPHANSNIPSNGIINQNMNNNNNNKIYTPQIQFLQRRSSAANAPQQIIPQMQQNNQQSQQKQALIQQQQLQLLQSASKQHQLEESLKKQQQQLQESSQKKVSKAELNSSTDLKSKETLQQQQYQQHQQLINSTDNLSRNLFGSTNSQNQNYQQQQSKNQQYQQIIQVNGGNNTILRSSVDASYNQQQQFQQQLQQQQQQIMSHSSDRFASNPVKLQFSQPNGVILKQVNQPQFQQVFQNQQQNVQQFQSKQQSRQDLKQAQQSHPTNTTTPIKQFDQQTIQQQQSQQQFNQDIASKAGAEVSESAEIIQQAKNLSNTLQTLNSETKQKQSVSNLQNSDLKLNQPQATIKQGIAPSKPAQPPSSIGIRQTDSKQGNTLQHNRQSNSLDAKGKQQSQAQLSQQQQTKQEQQSEQLLLQQESQEYQPQQQYNQHQEVYSSSEKQHSSRYSIGKQTQQEQTQESSKRQQHNESQFKQPEKTQAHNNLGEQSFQDANQEDQDNYRESQILSELRAQREQSQQLKELLLQSSQKSNHEYSRDLISEQKKQSRQLLNTSGPEILVQRLWCSEEKVIALQSELEVYKQKLLTARIDNERQERKALQVEADTDRLRLEHERLKEDYEILKIYNERIIAENDRLILQLEKQYQHSGMIWPVQQSSIHQHLKGNQANNVNINQNSEMIYQQLRKEQQFSDNQVDTGTAEFKRISLTGQSNQDTQQSSYNTKNSQNLIQPVRFLRQPEGSTKQQTAAQFLSESPEKQLLQQQNYQHSPQRPLPPLPNTNLSTNSYTINYTANNNNSRTYTAPSVVVADGILQAEGESRHSTLFSQLNDSHFSMPPTPEQNLPLFKYQK